MAKPLLSSIALALPALMLMTLSLPPYVPGLSRTAGKGSEEVELWYTPCTMAVTVHEAGAW